MTQLYVYIQLPLTKDRMFVWSEVTKSASCLKYRLLILFTSLILTSYWFLYGTARLNILKLRNKTYFRPLGCKSSSVDSLSV